MLKKKTSGSVLWIDLESPTDIEVKEVNKILDIDSLDVEELLFPSARHKVEFGESHAYLVLHFPAFKESRDGDAAYEVDFIITKNTIVTVHYSHIDSLSKLEVEDETEKELFFLILSELIGSFEKKLSSIDHWVREIEKNMFSGKEKEAVFALSEATRHLIDFKKITSSYPDAFLNLEEGGEKIFGKRFGRSTRALAERSEKAASKLAVLSGWASELRETNSALLNIKQNETMKMLTFITVVTDLLFGIILIYLAVHGH